MDTREEQALKLIQALERGSSGYAHPKTIELLRLENPELAEWFSPCKFLEEGCLLAINMPLYKLGVTHDH